MTTMPSAFLSALLLTSPIVFAAEPTANSVKQHKAGLGFRESLLEEGFLKEYAQSTMENDLNAMAKLLFTGDGARWAMAEKHPKIRQKLQLTLAFYERIDAGLNEAWFRSFVVEKPRSSSAGQADERSAPSSSNL